VRGRTTPVVSPRRQHGLRSLLASGTPAAQIRYGSSSGQHGPGFRGLEIGCPCTSRLIRVSAWARRDTLPWRPRCLGPRGQTYLGYARVGSCRRRSIRNPAGGSPGGVPWPRGTSIGPRGRCHRAPSFRRTWNSDLHGRQSLRARRHADRPNGIAQGGGTARHADRVSAKPNHRRHPRPSHLA
jgi:hypothetical protein